MTPAEIERKVRQHDNDLESIYEMLGTILGTQAQHGNRLDEVAAKLTEHDGRFDAMDRRFDGIDGRLDGMGQQLEVITRLLKGPDSGA